MQLLKIFYRLVLVVGAVFTPTLSVAGEPSGSMPPSRYFSGLYAGIHVGAVWSDSTLRDNGTPGSLLAPPYGAFACGPALTGNYCSTPFRLDADGLVAGGQIGANWRHANLVFGVEGEFGGSNLDEGRTLIRPFQDRDIASVNMDWYAALTGRLGLVVGDRMLVYTKAGAAFARLSYFGADIDLTGTPASFQIYQGSVARASGTSTGWTIGGGLEYAFDSNVSLKLEYLYTDFGSKTAVSPEGDRYKFETDMHAVKFGLNFALPVH